MLTRIAFACAITLVLAVGALHALCELMLATRPRLEAWQARRAHGSDLFPRDWHWPGLPR